MTERVCLIFVLCLFITLFFLGCGDDGGVTVVNTGQGNTGTPSATTTITGVVRYSSGVSVGEGIKVTLTPLVGDSVSAAEAYGEQQNSTTDASGEFLFTVNYTGIYFIEAKENGEVIKSKKFTVDASGQAIYIELGPATEKLTVNITPDNADIYRVHLNSYVSDEVETSDISSAELEASASQYVFYRKPGFYHLRIWATGYDRVDEYDVEIVEGQDSEITVDISSYETPVTFSSIEPCVCLNSGIVPLEITLKNASGTVRSIALLDSSDNIVAEVTSGITSDSNDVNIVTADFDVAGIAPGEYKIRVTHNPPTVAASESTDEYEGFYIEDTIQKAIYRASQLAGTNKEYTAYIPAGTYDHNHPALPVLPIEMKRGVYLKGAGKDVTTIDGTGSGGRLFNVHSDANGQRIKNTTIGGFTLTGGNGVSSSFENGSGGAVYCGDYVEGFCLKNNNIVSNNVSDFGGGIYIHPVNLSGGVIEILDNEFTGNTSNFGGAIGAYMENGTATTINVKGNIITGQTATSGAGMYLYVDFSSSMCIESNKITGNDSGTGDGGGISIYNWSGASYIKNNDIYGNTGTFNGAQLFYGISIVQVNAANNYWGSASPTFPDSEVYSESSGTVNVTPYATTPFFP